jgi:hypothetical protein
MWFFPQFTELISLLDAVLNISVGLRIVDTTINGHLGDGKRKNTFLDNINQP